MNRFIAISLLFVFSLLNVATAYNAYKKGLRISFAVVEEDESHTEILEVKKFINQEENPFEIFAFYEYQSNHMIDHLEIKYEDVLLVALKTPPDEIC